MYTLVKGLFGLLRDVIHRLAEGDNGTRAFVLRDMQELPHPFGIALELHHAVHPYAGISGRGDRQHDVFCGSGVVLGLKLKIMVAAMNTFRGNHNNDRRGFTAFVGKISASAWRSVSFVTA